MKEKIFSNLKTKYSDLGFSKQILDGVAAYLAKTVTEEAQIEAVVADVEPILRILQSDTDRIRTELNSVKTQNEDLKKKIESMTKEEGGFTRREEEPEWFKAYKEQQESRFNQIQEENESFKQEKAKAARVNLIETKARELGIPDWRMKEGFTIADDADEAAIVQHLTGVQKNLVTAGLMDKRRFPLEGKGEVSKEEADAIADKMKF